MNPSDGIQWAHPWRPLRSEHEKAALPRRLAQEITEGHPLCGKGCSMIGRNDSSDDFVLACTDGSVAIVHLTFQGPGDAKFPRTTIYDTAKAANDAMWRIAVEQGWIDDFDPADPRLWDNR